MQLPAIREKISSLPRPLKILLLISSILVLVIIAEMSYYLWALKGEAEESKYVNTELVHKEGAFLYSKETNEPIAIKGYVTKIEDWFLTIENQGEKVLIEIDRDFQYTKITEEPKEVSKEEIEEFGAEIKTTRNSLEDLSADRKKLVEKGFVVIPENPEIDDLSQLIAIGDFVVISKIKLGEAGAVKGEVLSVLEFLRG